MARSALGRQRLQRSIVWNVQLAQLTASLQRSCGAAACCVATLEGADNGYLRQLHCSGESANAAFWGVELAALPPLVQLAASDYTRSTPQGVVRAFALGSEGAPESCLLLLFADSLPAEPQLLAIVALYDQGLRQLRQTIALQRRTMHLERQQALRLREIKNSRNYLRGIIDNITVGLVLIDGDGTVRAINSTLAQRFGYAPADLVGKHYGIYLGSWSQAVAAQTLAHGRTVTRRVELIHPDQTRALIEITGFPLFDTHGKIQRAVEVWEDITQQTALQNQLIRVEKLAALGQLAASVAHEVGNPLQAVQGFIALFLESCPPDVANRSYLQVADQEIDRVARVVARLRDFYRPSTDVLAPVAVNALLEDVLLLTGKQLQHSRIALVRQFQPDMPQIMAVADQLKQVTLNLVLNAVEAMPEGGTLTISTRTINEAPRGKARPTRRRVQAVEIVVADNGVGIAPDRIGHLFDGLQTTKARGMGLGLYTSKAIIDRHMGRINVESSPGEGTAFSIVLPVGIKET